MDVQMPDGTIISGVPEGYTKQQVLEKYQGNSRSGNLTSDALSQFAQGATFGLADEATGGLAALMSARDKGSLKDFSKDYGQFRDMQRGYDKSFQQENPLSSLALNLAGGVGTGIAGGTIAKAVAPEALGALESYATQKPIQSIAGTGAVSGSLYGAGSGEGGVPQRLEQAALGAGAGGVIGAAGGVTAPIIGRTLGNVVDRFATKNAPELSQEAQSIIRNTAGDPNFNPSPIAQTQDLFPKTAGQSTQNVDLQRLENNSFAGLITPQAQEAAFATKAAQNAKYKEYLSSLGGNLETGRDINGIIDDLGSTIKQQYGNIKGQVSNAYDLASQGKGVKISNEEVNKGLLSNISDLRSTNSYDLSQLPKASKVIQDLSNLSSPNTNGVNVTSVKLAGLEGWRKRATNALSSTQDPTEKRFLGQIINSYDNFMDNTAANAVDIGDSKAINAFRDAVKLRATQGQLFEKNKLVNDLAMGNLSIDDARRKLLGTGAIRGQGQMAQNLDAIIKAGGTESGSIKSDLQNTFIKNIYNQSKEGLEQGSPDTVNISPAKLKTNLENLFVHQSSFATKLYGKEAVDQAQKAIRELELISKSQPSVRNASGSGELIGRLMNPIIDRIPVVGHGAAILRKGGELLGQKQATDQAVQSLSGTVPKNFQTIIKSQPASRFWRSGPQIPSDGILPGGLASGAITIRNTGNK